MILRKFYRFLSSAKLAMALLVAVLAICLTTAVSMSQARAWELVFGTLWFNSLLVFLVINIAFCFFPRMWGRKMTLVSFGMILFHLSFVSILIGITYNSLFYFRGMIRLTEGETLPSGAPESYSSAEHGRFFNYAWLRGSTELIKLHPGYKIGKEDKRVAYEISVGEGRAKKQGVIYLTNSLSHNGFGYYNNMEGYSILVILYDSNGNELYGAHFPLQSLKKKDDTYLYTTGSRTEAGRIYFPHDPAAPLFTLQIGYQPSKQNDRGGDIVFNVQPLDDEQSAKVASAGGQGRHVSVPAAEGKVAVGEKLKFGQYFLEGREVRYWAGIDVRFDPGKPIVLASLWIGLAGMVMTFIGRTRRR